MRIRIYRRHEENLTVPSKLKLINNLFIAMVCATVLAYVVQAIYVLSTRSYVLWSYSQYSINVGSVGTFTNFFKDIIALILFAILMFDNVKNFKIGLGFGILIVYGAVLVQLNGMNFVRYTISGIREYLFFVVTLMYFVSRKRFEKDYGDTLDQKNIRILMILACFEFICSYGQVLNSGQFIAGGGAYRFAGTFGNAGGLGAYCIGMIMLLGVYFLNRQEDRKIGSYIILAMTIVMTIISGMRSAMISVLLILVSVVLIVSYEKLHLQKRTMLFTFIIICICTGSAVITNISKFSARGDIMVSGGTRINILADFLGNDELLSFLFGHGIGYGTNSAVSLGAEGAIIADGTLNTTIAQFGLIGLFLFIIIAGAFSVRILFEAGRLRMVAACCLADIWLIFVTGNYFEQFSLVVLSIYAFYLLEYQSVKEDKGEVESCEQQLV